MKTSLTKAEAEEILGFPIDDSLWEWIVNHNRQEEIRRSPAYERGEIRGFGTPRYFREQEVSSGAVSPPAGCSG